MTRETVHGPCHPHQRSLLARTKRRLRRLDLRAKKSLGQHFLVDEEVLRLIVSAAGITTEDIVVEVGPGLGILTEALAEKAGWVAAVEIDSRLAAALAEQMALSQNVTVITGDILEMEPASMLRDASAGTADYKVVANLPYYITSAVLRHFLEAEARPQTMVVMMQKDVAEVITAGPGDMSLLAVSVQLYGRPEIISMVPAESFYPTPAVDSAVLRIERHSQPPGQVADEADFFNLVRAGFSAKRKQLVNSLAQGLQRSKAEVSSLLERAGIAARRRAETLSLEEWAQLYRVFKETGR